MVKPASTDLPLLELSSSFPVVKDLSVLTKATDLFAWKETGKRCKICRYFSSIARDGP